MSLQHTYFPMVSPALVGLFLSAPLASLSAVRPYTVIIPLYNKEDTIRSTLLSVLAQTRKPREIILVNDKSTDRSLEKIAGFEEHINLINNEVNMGKAQSINKALEQVKTPYVLILDADTVLREDYAEKLMRGFNSDKVVGVSGVVLPTSIKSRTEKARLIEYLLATSHKKTQVKLGGVWTLSGCSMMWKTDILRKMGGIPTGTIVEDMDVSWKAQTLKNENGEYYTLSYSPNAISYTDDPKTFNDYVKQIDRWFSVREVIKKNAPKIKKGLLVTASWTIVETVFPFIFLAVASYFLVTLDHIKLVMMLGLDLALLTALSLYLGGKYKYGIRDVLSGIKWFWIYRFVNAVRFWYRMIKPKAKW